MASDNTFHLIVASVGDTRFDGAAASATFPGESGEFTVLAHHEAFVSTLKRGMITVRRTGVEPLSFEIEGGVFEMSGSRAVVLL